mmetsp:Transcript_43756/g.137389  ORF Transcript_43756/g.137389 Transcript_43756/m.137389 type:complete len:318 (+) Transcript_43756:586-1539(+)
MAPLAATIATPPLALKHAVQETEPPAAADIPPAHRVDARRPPPPRLDVIRAVPRPNGAGGTQALLGGLRFARGVLREQVVGGAPRLLEQRMQPPQLAPALRAAQPGFHRLEVAEAEDRDVLEAPGRRVRHHVEAVESVAGEAAHDARHAMHLFLELLRALPAHVVVRHHGDALGGVPGVAELVVRRVLLRQRVQHLRVAQQAAVVAIAVVRPHEIAVLLHVRADGVRPREPRLAGVGVRPVAPPRVEGKVIAGLEAPAALAHDVRLDVAQAPPQPIRGVLERLELALGALEPRHEPRVRLVLGGLEEPQALLERRAH